MDGTIRIVPKPEAAPVDPWTKDLPTEADWYMVRGPGFRTVVQIVDIAGIIEPAAPYSWATFDGCEFARVTWPPEKARET